MQITDTHIYTHKRKYMIFNISELKELVCCKMTEHFYRSEQQFGLKLPFITYINDSSSRNNHRVSLLVWIHPASRLILLTVHYSPNQLNSVFLSQQTSRNSVFQPSFRPANGTIKVGTIGCSTLFGGGTPSLRARLREVDGAK